jgi:hypothetical protein
MLATSNSVGPKRKRQTATESESVSYTPKASPADANAAPPASEQELKSTAPTERPTFDRRRPPARFGLRSRLGTATLALAALVIGLTLWGSLRLVPADPVVRYSLAMADGEGVSDFRGIRFAISSDGSQFVYVSGQDRSLRVRQRDQLHAPKLRGTEGAGSPFFSPDGERVAFISQGRLKVATLRDGTVMAVTAAIDPVGGVAWGSDGFIYMSQPGFGGVYRVEPEAGAEPEPVTRLDPTRKESNHSWPDVLPNGRGVLFTAAHAEIGGVSTHSIAVSDMESRTHRYLADGIFARYSPSGHLVFVSPDSALMVAPFDIETMELTGPATLVRRGQRVAFRRSIDLGVSANGTLMYATAPGRSAREVVWVSRDGTARPLDPPWRGDMEYPALSPDESRMALVVNSPGRADVWIRDLTSGATSKLTVDEDVTGYPSWTPDGESVTYFWNTGNGVDLWTKSAGGGAPAVHELDRPLDLAEALWSGDGTWLIYRTFNVPRPELTGSGEAVPGAADIFAVRPGVEMTPIPLATTKFPELAPSLSPDGNWLAYASEETGKEEIFIVPFPDAHSGKWSVSPNGGSEPLWSASGDELFYRDLRGNLIAVEIATQPNLSIGASKILFNARAYLRSGLHRSYDVASDGEEFIMVREVEEVEPGEVIVVENWFAELTGRR